MGGIGVGGKGKGGRQGKGGMDMKRVDSRSVVSSTDCQWSLGVRQWAGACRREITHVTVQVVRGSARRAYMTIGKKSSTARLRTQMKSPIINHAATALGGTGGGGGQRESSPPTLRNAAGDLSD